MEKTSNEERIMLERQNLRQSIENLKVSASEIISCTRQLKAVHKHNEMVQANNNKRSHELELKEKDLLSLRSELDERCKLFEANKKKMSRELEGKEKELQRSSSDLDKKVKKSYREIELKEKELQTLSSELDKRVEKFGKEKSEAGNLKRLVEECGEELRLKRNELTAKLDASTKLQREIESKKTRLGQYSAELRKLCNEAGKVQIHKKEMEEEMDRKKRDLALIVSKMEDSGRQLVAVDKQVESQRRLLEFQSCELVSKEGELERVRESIKIFNSDIELKENKVQALQSCLTVCGQEIDSKSKELGEIHKLIEQQSSELCVMCNECDVIKLFIHELSGELVTKEKTHKELSETISRSCFEMEEKAREIRAAETQATDLNVRSDRLRQEVTDKEKELDLLTSQIKSEDNKLIHLEEETESKKQHLVLILNKIEESSKQLMAVDEQLKSQEKQLKMQSLELLSKKELDCVRESSKRSTSDLEVKENRIKALDKLIATSGEQLDLKSKELEEIQLLIEEQTIDLCVMHKEHNSLKVLIQGLAEELHAKEKHHKEILEGISRSYSEMESVETETRVLNVKAQEFRSEVKDREKEHDSLKVLIQGLAEELHAKEKQHKEILEAIARSNSEMESVETETRVLNAKAQGVRSEVKDREKELDCLKNQITSEENKLLQLTKSIQDCNSELRSRRGQVEAMKKNQRELELKKQLRQMSSVLVKHEAPINYTSQQNATENEAVIEDMHHGGSTLLERNEVSSVLRGLANPSAFILELMQDEIRKEVELNDSLVKIWVLLFEELMKIQREDEPGLQQKATQVATLWKRKITFKAPKSSLETLAFLLFIVAYGLGALINQEETGLLASSIAQYEQAPTLFNSLKLDIPETVEYLIQKRHYVPAVQLICAFKLDKDFPASHLLAREIINLRRSALERGPAESSQAKEKDGERLRAILELVADYKLEINLPGDLIARLMIESENSTPLAHCSARHHSSASNPQANALNLASAQVSSVSLRVPKPEVKPCLN